jgi:putative toxin-antitoxin system antitoxin component (TIGR02293 family)
VSNFLHEGKPMTTQKRAAKRVIRKGDLPVGAAGKAKKKRAPVKALRVDFRRQGREDQFAHVRKLLIGRAKAKTDDPVELIRDGLPLESIERIQAHLALADEQPILKLLGMSKRTYQRRLKDGKGLDAVESDRLYRLAKIEARAAEVFRDDAVAVDWLRTENRALGDEPINLLDTEAGTDMVERALTRIEHGVFA